MADEKPEPTGKPKDGSKVKRVLPGQAAVDTAKD